MTRPAPPSDATTPGPPRPSTLLAVGPPEHGVTAAGLLQAPAHDRVLRGGVELLQTDLSVHGSAGSPAGPNSAGSGSAGPVHVHVTDRLFGASPEEAADVLVALAARVPLVVTLHDLPQPSDGVRNHPRRRAAYSRIADAARHVVVSSEHERALLTTTTPVTVVPLPIPTYPPPARGADPGRRPTAVAVLGYLYPGKGHAPTLAAMADLPTDVGLVAFGRTSPGHEDLEAELQQGAAALGRSFSVTGYLPEPDLIDRLRSAVIPVAAHEHLSASGSIGTWVAAGRRPIVPPSAWAEEFERRNPGALQFSTDLRRSVTAAFADPAGTFLAPGTVLRPSVEDTVSAIRAVLRGVV